MEELSLGRQERLPLGLVKPGSSSLSGHLKIRRGDATDSVGRRGHVTKAGPLCVGQCSVQVKTWSLLTRVTTECHKDA